MRWSTTGCTNWKHKAGAERYRTNTNCCSTGLVYTQYKLAFLLRCALQYKGATQAKHHSMAAAGPNKKITELYRTNNMFKTTS